MTADLSNLARCTQELLGTADSLDDLAGATLCDGWDRAHVLTHVARNADAICRLVQSAVTGERQEMYPGGPAARDAEIDQGSRRNREEILADLHRTSERVAERLRALDGPLVSDEVEMRDGVVAPAARLPFLRLREVVFHHADLDAGFTLEQVDGELLASFIRDAVRRLRASGDAPSLTLRSDEGDVWSVGDGTAYVTGSRAGILLWLARRIPDGVHADHLPELPKGN